MEKIKICVKSSDNENTCFLFRKYIGKEFYVINCTENKCWMIFDETASLELIGKQISYSDAFII